MALMDDADVMKQLWRFDPDVPVERAHTPPGSWYTTPEFHDLERTVFLESWQAVARTDQFEREGDCVTGVLAGEPWVIVFGENRRLRAFKNVCAHHAAEVVQCDGNLAELVCPYHGWKYDLDGRLSSAPRMAGVTEFDRDQVGLKPIDIATWGPLVFIRFGGDAAPPADALLELTARLDKTGTDRLTWWARRTFVLDCNWKVFVDNYLDGGYHVAHLHPKLASELDLDTYRLDAYEDFSIQTCGGGGFDDRLGDGAIYAWIWPNLMVNRYGPVLDVNIVSPLAPDKCAVIFDWWFEDTEGAEAEEFIAEAIEESVRVQHEDDGICASVQRGLASSGYDAGRYSPHLEHAMWRFHRRLWDVLRRAASDGA